MSTTTESEFTPTSKRGTALLREVLAVIETELKMEYADLSGHEQHGGRWDQRDWGSVRVSQAVRDAAVETYMGAAWQAVPAAVVLKECGTTACVAGHASLLVGDRPLIESVTLDDSPGVVVSWALVLPVDGADEATMVEDRARELLGLTEDEAAELFEGANSIDDVRMLIGNMLDRRGVVL